MRVCAPEHLPGRRGDAGSRARKKFAGQPEHVSISCLHCREVREIQGPDGPQIRDMVGRSDMLFESTKRSARTGKPNISTCRLCIAPTARGAALHNIQSRSRPKDSLDNTGLSPQGAAREFKTGKRCTPSFRSRNKKRTSARPFRRDLPKKTAARACPTTRSLSNSTARQASASLLAARRNHAPSEGDGHEYVGKGLSGGASPSSPEGGHLTSTTTSSPERHRLRAPTRRNLHPRPSGRTILTCATRSLRRRWKLRDTDANT